MATKAPKTAPKANKSPEIPPGEADPSLVDLQVPSDLKGLVDRLQKEHPGSVFMGGGYTMPWLLRRYRTGILDMDIALMGGWPGGGMSMVVAPESVGKNWVLNKTIAEAQRVFGASFRCGIVSTEMPWDKTYARQNGVQVRLSEIEIGALEAAERRVIPGFTFSGSDLDALRRELGAFVVVPPTTAEGALEIAAQMIESRKFHIVAIDSFGSLLTDEEDTNGLEKDSRVGGSAKLQTAFARRLNVALSPDAKGMPPLTCVFGINQVRDNMNRANAYSPELKEGGAHAIKHGRWAAIQMSRRAFIKKGEQKVGKIIGWEVTRQKAGGHEGAVGALEYYYDLPGGLDRWAHSLSVATDWKVVKKREGGLIYEGNGVSVEAKDLPTLVEAFATAANGDPAVLYALEDQVLTAAGIRCNYQ